MCSVLTYDPRGLCLTKCVLFSQRVRELRNAGDSPKSHDERNKTAGVECVQVVQERAPHSTPLATVVHWHVSEHAYPLREFVEPLGEFLSECDAQPCFAPRFGRWD